MSAASPDWLPPLVTLPEHEGNWEKYLNAIYDYFAKDFLGETLPRFMGMKVSLRKHPVTDGKEFTFWHFISEGRYEEERIPDLRRCERIRWPRPIIEEGESDRVLVWKTKRGRKTRFVLGLPDFSYVVVLDERKDYVLPLTAYHVERSHRREKLQREYEAYKKTGA